MTTYQAILDAADKIDYDDSIRSIKQIAVRTLAEADRDATLFVTEHFNHSYLPDFVMRWDGRPDRFVFLRATSYAQEIEDDVKNLGDRHPMFIQLSQFHSPDETSSGDAIARLNQSASESRALVATIPAIEHFDDLPQTGRMLSSFVMRGGRGVVADGAARAIAQKVDSGFIGAMIADREATADAIDAVEAILDPRSNSEFARLFEAAWISGGAAATDFPGGVRHLGDDISSDILQQLLRVVPAENREFWEQIGETITLDSLAGLHLVGEQPQLQSIMKRAIHRSVANRFDVRRTARSDQQADPFIWQVDSGRLSLRGDGHQGWLGQAPAGNDAERGLPIEAPISLSELSTRCTEAALHISEVGVTDSDGIEVAFSSPEGRDLATSDLFDRVTGTLGESVSVNNVVARVDGRSVPVDYARGTARARTNAKIPAGDLVWAAWNLLASTRGEIRNEILQAVGKQIEPDTANIISDSLDDNPG